MVRSERGAALLSIIGEKGGKCEFAASAQFMLQNAEAAILSTDAPDQTCCALHQTKQYKGSISKFTVTTSGEDLDQYIHLQEYPSKGPRRSRSEETCVTPTRNHTLLSSTEFVGNFPCAKNQTLSSMPIHYPRYTLLDG